MLLLFNKKSTIIALKQSGLSCDVFFFSSWFMTYKYSFIYLFLPLEGTVSLNHESILVLWVGLDYNQIFQCKQKGKLRDRDYSKWN